jgi:hypothetical protein
MSMPTGGAHYTAELYWQGGYHIVDANQTVWFPTPWGYFAGFEDLVDDCSLVGWQEDGFYGFYNCRAPGPYSEFDYGVVTNRPGVNRSYTYNIGLRRGESIVRRWWTDKEPRWKNRGFDPATVATGMYPEDGLTLSDFRLVPDFADPPENIHMTNIRVTKAGDLTSLSVKDPSTPATIEVTFSNAFLERQDAFWTGWDGVKQEVTSWISGVFESEDGTGEIRVYARDYQDSILDSYVDLGSVSLRPEWQERVKGFSLVKQREDNPSKVYLNRILQFNIIMNGNVRLSNLDFVA